MAEIYQKTILVVDDDFFLCQLLNEYLSSNGFIIQEEHDGSSALKRVLAGDNFDLMILDVMMPKMDGLQLLKEIRNAGFNFPVIMLTAKGEPDDRIAGLELGADDYLPKPFEPRELLARIQAIIRRTEPTHDAGISREIDILTRDDLELNAKTYLALSCGKPLHLTPAEFRLLWLLLLKAGEIVSRELLFQKVLGREESPYDRSLDIHISRLRKKIGPGSDGCDRLKSIRGEGYLYVQAAGE